MTSVARGSWKWWVCGALLLATMLLYMDRLTLSVTATQLKREMQLSDARYGQIEAWFSYAFAVGGIGFGFIADRLGPRRLYPFVLVGWSLAGLLTPLASWPALTQMLGNPGDAGSGEFTWLLICRTMLGLFEAGHWPCALITARNILSEDDRPLGNSILQSGASLGAVLTPLIIQAFRGFGAPWQMPFVVIGAIGILWVPLWTRLIGPHDIRPRIPSVDVASKPSIPLPRVFAQFLTLIVVVITISMAWQFQRAWLPKYLKEHHDYSEATANYFTSGYYIVADVGCLFFGGVVSVLTWWRLHVRVARLVVFGMCAALMALAAVVPTMDRGPWLLVAIALAGAGALGAHPQYYALAQELPTRHMGLLSGVLSAASWVAVGIMQSTMGGYIDRMNAIDPAHAYDLPLTITGFAPLVGFAAMAAWVALARGGSSSSPPPK